MLVANRHSGRGRKWHSQVLRCCDAAGIDLASVCTDLSAEALKSAVEQARGQQVDAVLACGGDGTVGSVARCLITAGPRLGILPAGSSNDFARSLSLPLDVEGAVRVIAAGRTVSVDMGDVETEAFVHAAAVGLNAQFAASAQRLRRYIGRLSYPVAAVQTYLQRRPLEFHLRVDGEERSILALQIAFVNAPVMGGGLDLHVPEASLANGKLSALVIHDLTLRDAFTGAVRSLRRGRLEAPGVHELEFRRLELLKPLDATVTLDGEDGPTTPALVCVLPAALQVIVPDDFPLAGG